MSLVYPAAAMVGWIWLAGAFVFYTRVTHARKGLIKVGYYRTMDAEKYNPPEYLVRAGRHYDNLMQLPMLFFATVAIALAVKVESTLILSAAWLFVVSRVAHTLIHLGSNHVIKRMSAFFFGWFCILAMWLAILIH
jgi:hypothetical protein